MTDRTNDNYNRGRNANLANLPRDTAQNIDWLLGWDDAEDARRLDEADD
jgi:hypothetical protein